MVALEYLKISMYWLLRAMSKCPLSLSHSLRVPSQGGLKTVTWRDGPSTSTLKTTPKSKSHIHRAWPRHLQDFGEVDNAGQSKKHTISTPDNHWANPRLSNNAIRHTPAPSLSVTGQCANQIILSSRVEGVCVNATWNKIFCNRQHLTGATQLRSCDLRLYDRIYHMWSATSW